MSDDQQAEAEKHRLEGNEYFKKQQFLPAIDCYTKGIEKCSSLSLRLNRAMAALKVGYSGEALEDADEALKIEPQNPKAFYRKGVAYMQLFKLKEALVELRTLNRLLPDDVDAKERLQACEKEHKRQQFLKAIEQPDSLPPSQRIKKQPELMKTVAASYDGPRFPEEGGVTPEYVNDVAQYFKDEKLIPQRDVVMILTAAIEELKKSPNVVTVATMADDEEIIVVGDTHGQYYDTLNIFELVGKPQGPGGKRQFVFNGDYVDRGSYSVENVVLLLAFKALYPTKFFMSRGNHESMNLNIMYGFRGEVEAKYNDFIFELMQEAFGALPLAHVLNEKVFVTHGGLFSKDDVTIEELQKLSRFRDIPDSGPMCEMLWADPMAMPGRGKSKRGTGLDFGPDVTRNFLERNKLELVVRSHEVNPEGYLELHGGKLITVFSAPNYCDQVGNKGAVLRFVGKTAKPEFVQYAHVKHPGKKPMAYAARGMLGF